MAGMMISCFQGWWSQKDKGGCEIAILKFRQGNVAKHTRQSAIALTILVATLAGEGVAVTGVKAGRSDSSLLGRCKLLLVFGWKRSWLLVSSDGGLCSAWWWVWGASAWYQC